MPGIPAAAESQAVQSAARCLLSLRGREDALDTSQLKNFLEAAVASRDARSIETWVLYQMGRSKRNEKWRVKGQGAPNAFGDAVAEVVRGSWGLEPAESGITSPTRLELIRIFAGQLSRLHTYLEEFKEAAWPAIEALTEEGQ